MAINVHYEADLDLIKARRVAVIGYGSQGHAHALNLHDSGVEVVVGLRDGSSSRDEAAAKGLAVKSISEATRWGDVIVLLVPDQHQKRVYEEHMVEHMKPGKALVFGHGFNIHYDQIVPPEGVDVFMVAPKSPGHLARRVFEEGKGVPCLVAVAQDASGSALELALSYAKGIGGIRAGVIETTFKDETETDLFGEQAVLCGGAEALIKAGFETLTEAGYPPELAYFECLHELKLIVDLIYEGGLEYMNFSISDTAEYGNYTRGPQVIDTSTKQRMREILGEVQDGTFAREWIKENETGTKQLLKLRQESRDHPIETIGRKLRSMMSWIRGDEKASAQTEEAPAQMSVE